MLYSIILDDTILFHLGVITTTSRKLDREQQAEHFLEVFYACPCIITYREYHLVIEVIHELNIFPHIPCKYIQQD